MLAQWTMHLAMYGSAGCPDASDFSRVGTVLLTLTDEGTSCPRLFVTSLELPVGHVSRHGWLQVSSWYQSSDLSLSQPCRVLPRISTCRFRCVFLTYPPRDLRPSSHTPEQPSVCPSLMTVFQDTQPFYFL